ELRALGDEDRGDCSQGSSGASLRLNQKSFCYSENSPDTVTPEGMPFLTDWNCITWDLNLAFNFGNLDVKFQ
ncbi:mCG140705, isoform CRA_d, partial [Mus musculus]